jgi:hypothetical protein
MIFGIEHGAGIVWDDNPARTLQIDAVTAS